MSSFSNFALQSQLETYTDMSCDIFIKNILDVNILNLPRDLIIVILSYNGYYDYKGKFIKKIIHSEYENINNFVEYRLLNFSRGGIILYIPIMKNIETENAMEIEDLHHTPVKILSINYGYNPLHLIGYENVAPELMENNPIDPFDRRFSIEEVDNTEEPTMFYSIINYNCNNRHNHITFDVATVYMTMFNFKFDHYPYKPLNVLDMNDNEEFNLSDEEDYNNYFYDEYENYKNSY